MIYIVKIFYHTDLDGKCAGNVVYNNVEKENLKMFGVDYGLEYPIDKIEKDEQVYIVDFHFEPDVMKEILKITKNVVLIDHHKTCLEKYERIMLEEPFRHIEYFLDTTYSGCELAWLYFNEEELRKVIGYPYDMDMDEILFYTKDNREVIPELIRIVADRDLWQWKYGKKTYDVCNALEIYDTSPENNNWNEFNIERLEEEGYIISKYTTQRNKHLIERFHHIVKFEGYECDCINAGHVGSDIFDSINGSDLKPIQIMFIHDGDFFKISLRSGGKYKDIDVSEIAKKYGGGGHANSAGFESFNLPWETIK